MPTLSQADLEEIGSFLGSMLDARTLDDLREVLLPGLMSLVPADVASYNEIDPAAGRALTREHPVDSISREDLDVFERLVHQHPLINHFSRTGDRRALAFSDVLARRELESLELFNDFFRPIGLRYQMAVTVPGPPELVVGLAFNREGTDFSERDHAVLDLLSPHVAAAYERAREHEALGEYAAVLEDLAGDAGVAVVRLDGAGRVTRASAAGFELLSALMGTDPKIGERLPAWLEARLVAPERGQPPASVIVLSQLGEAFAAAALGAVPGGLPRLLVLSNAEGEVANEQAQRAGLTPRELDVIRAVAGGLTDGEAAVALDVGVRTVQKHLENIYAKLGVHTRTGAVMRVFPRGLPT